MINHFLAFGSYLFVGHKLRNAIDDIDGLPMDVIGDTRPHVFRMSRAALSPIASRMQRLTLPAGSRLLP